MKYRQVPSAGLSISEVSFGCGGNAGLMLRGTYDEQKRIVARALELGINYFDTAAQYGNIPGCPSTNCDALSGGNTALRPEQADTYTFGFNFTPTFLNLLLEVGADRIMFSADHPYASMSRARSFLDQLPVSASDKEKIAYRNAERLFGL